MGPGTSFWPQRAVKEALTLHTARELVRGHRVGAGTDGRVPRERGQESSVPLGQAGRRLVCAHMCPTVVSRCGVAVKEHFFPQIPQTRQRPHSHLCPLTQLLVGIPHWTRQEMSQWNM